MKSIFTICLFITSALAFGQVEESEQVDTTITSYLSEITISASRWEQNIREVPSKVTTIDNSLIQFQNPQTAADLLGVSDHVFIQKSQLGGGSPMLRGFATNRVMLVVDGVRMNNAIFRSGNVQNVISLDANAVREAEVVFGPGSVIYGSDAIGGVMDFHTLRPSFSTTDKILLDGNGLLRYSSANNERSAHVDVNVGGKKWSFLTSVTRSIYDDLRMGSNGPNEYTRPDYVVRENGQDVVRINSDPDVQVNSGYDQWNAMQKIAFKPSDHFRIDYAFHYSQTSDYPRYDRLILKEEGEFANGEWYYGPQKWMMNSLSVQYSKPTALFDQSRLILALQDFEESRHNRGFGSANKTSRTENVSAFSVNADLDKRLSNTFSIFYGFEFITNEVGSVATRRNVNTGTAIPFSTRYPDGSDWRSTAGYVSLRYTPMEKLTVNASGRYTSVYTHATFDRTFFDFPFLESSVTNNALNGSLGIVFNPSSAWKIYGNASTGFRAPNVDDIGKVFDSEPGNVVVPNPNLKSEYAYSAEVGFAGILANNFQIDLAGYYTVLDNAIARGPSTFNGQDSIDYDGVLSRVLSQQNISEVWISGIQAGIAFPLGRMFSLRSTFNYQKGREKDPETNRDVPPTHVAPSFGATHLIFRNNKLKADLYANYNGEIAYENLALSERGDSHLYAKDDSGNPYSPAWMTLNLKASYLINKSFTVDAGVENILDKRYRPYSSGVSAPGRNFIFSIRAKF